MYIVSENWNDSFVPLCRQEERSHQHRVHPLPPLSHAVRALQGTTIVKPVDLLRHEASSLHSCSCDFLFLPECNACDHRNPRKQQRPPTSPSPCVSGGRGHVNQGRWHSLSLCFSFSPSRPFCLSYSPSFPHTHTHTYEVCRIWNLVAISPFNTMVKFSDSKTQASIVAMKRKGY